MSPILPFHLNHDSDPDQIPNNLHIGYRIPYQFPNQFNFNFLVLYGTFLPWWVSVLHQNQLKLGIVLLDASFHFFSRCTFLNIHDRLFKEMHQIVSMCNHLEEDRNTSNMAS